MLWQISMKQISVYAIWKCFFSLTKTSSFYFCRQPIPFIHSFIKSCGCWKLL